MGYAFAAGNAFGNALKKMTAVFRTLAPWLRVRALIVARRKRGEAAAALWQALLRLLELIASFFGWPPLAGEANEAPPWPGPLRSVVCLVTSGSPHPGSVRRGGLRAV
jgi:hypothetical protein